MNATQNTTLIILDGQSITLEQLDEKKSNLKGSERIVEVSQNVYETITRMNG